MPIEKPEPVFGNHLKTSDQFTPPSPAVVSGTAEVPYGSVQALKASNNYFVPGNNFGPTPVAVSRSHKSELGNPGLEIYSGLVHEEFVSNLQGQNGIQIFEEMRKNDPIIGAMLVVAEQLLYNASVFIKPAPKNREAQESKMAADLVKTAIDDLDTTWPDTLGEILTMLPFGWSYCAVWHKKREGYHRNYLKSSKHDDGKYGWAGISLRGQSTLDSWVTDEKGRATGMIQRAPAAGYQKELIPLSHAGHFRTKTEKDNPEGYSILRNAYYPWHLKKRLERVEAIGIERDLTGLCIITTPEGIDLWNPNDASAVATLTRAQEMAALARVDTYGGIVVPFGWVVDIKTTPGQRAQQSDTVIQRWDQRIAVTLLADMLLIGHERVGSYALVRSKHRLFSSALESYAARIAGVFNRHLIPRLMLMNGIPQEYWPVMSFGSVDTPDLKELSEMINTMSQANINIDENIGRWLRAQMGMPPPEEGENAVKSFEEQLDEKEKGLEVDDKFKPEPQPFGQPPGGGKPKPKDKAKKELLQNPVTRYALGLDEIPND